MLLNKLLCFLFYRDHIFGSGPENPDSAPSRLIRPHEKYICFQPLKVDWISWYFIETSFFNDFFLLIDAIQIFRRYFQNQWLWKKSLYSEYQKATLQSTPSLCIKLWMFLHCFLVVINPNLFGLFCFKSYCTLKFPILR